MARRFIILPFQLSTPKKPEKYRTNSGEDVGPSQQTPELNGREALYQAFNPANEKQADSAPVE
jgi:hypothetical protein